MARSGYVATEEIVPEADIVEAEIESVKVESVRAMSASDVADLLNVDPKTFRRFMRAALKADGEKAPGQGGRYAFTSDSFDVIKARFDAWHTSKGTLVTLKPLA